MLLRNSAITILMSPFSRTCPVRPVISLPGLRPDDVRPRHSGPVPGPVPGPAPGLAPGPVPGLVPGARISLHGHGSCSADSGDVDVFPAEIRRHEVHESLRLILRKHTHDDAGKTAAMNAADTCPDAAHIDS